MKKVLKGGTVVGGSGSVRADVLIDGEKVAAVGTGEEMERLADEDTQIVDVEGCLLFPGFIDAHTHFDLHVAGTVTADDFATGTRAAVRGGTTTIVDFGTSMKGRAWRTASGTGMRRRTASVPVITDSTCPYRTGTRRSAGNLTT